MLIQVHQLQNGLGTRIFLNGLISICLTQNAMKKIRDGHHSPICLQILNHYTEHHPTLSNSNSCFTFQANLFWPPSHLLLPSLHQVLKKLLLICHLFLVDLSHHSLHRTTLRFLTLTSIGLVYLEGSNIMLIRT